MRTSVAALTALSGLALALVSVAHANPVPDPVYTFCETEDNDLCSNPQILDANLAAASVGGGAEGEFVRDCFYLTGKLQEDCVWDIEPKCAMKVYDKPAPCRTTSGSVIPNQFYEPVVRSSNGEDLLNVVPLSDRTIRLGVAALQDAFDGTINGLANNGPHGETGEVTVKVFYHSGGDGQPRGDQPDQMYVFHFGGPADIQPELPDIAGKQIGCEDAMGTDALRVAFIIPANVTSVDIVCCNNTGQQALCYDVDHYKVTNLLPSRAYCLEVIGGLNDDSDPLGCAECGLGTDTLIGVFDKNCNLIDFNDDKVDCKPFPTPQGCRPDSVYSKICAFAEVDGSFRFAVTGFGDEDFNGLYDRAGSYQQDYFDLLERLRILDGLNYEYRQGASTKDASIDEVNRYPRFIWDKATNQNPFGEDFLGRFGGSPEAQAAHGICGGYCIKIQLAEHIDPSERPVPPQVMNSARADINSDGIVNASDLALLLSYWGIVN